MRKRTIVVVGGALSGPVAAAWARETDRSARVVLVERNPRASAGACGLPYLLSGEATRPSGPVVVSSSVERCTATARRIDARARTLHLSRGRLRFDALVYAAGAESLMPDVPGFAGARNVVPFRTLADLDAIQRALERGARRIVVLGGGFFGVEAADGLLRRGLEVTILERGPRVLPRFGATVAHMAHRSLQRSGVRILAPAEPARAERAGGRVVALRLRRGRTVPADLVVVAAGVRPRSGLLARAGARLHPDGSVLVDGRCATSLPGVFACGVCVALPHAVTGRPVWMAQAAPAVKTARVAGAAAAGADDRIGPVLGSAIVRAGGIAVARTGLLPEDAGAFAEGELVRTLVLGPSRDPILPSAATLTLELTHHRSGGRLLAAEAAGPDGVDRAIDVLAAAIQGGMTVAALAGLDLAYAPPYAPPIDPVNAAAAVAARSS